METNVESDVSKWWGRLNVDKRFLVEGQPIIYWFRDQYSFLSNFYVGDMVYKDDIYHSSENAFQAAKAKDDEAGLMWKEKIQDSFSPVKAKKYGKQLPLREDWDEVKVGIMKEIVLAKFLHPVFRVLLLNTGNAYLVEGTTWCDNTWGICINEDCNRGCENKIGMNHLGNILMGVRREIAIE